jgi:hypothetical protein
MDIYALEALDPEPIDPAHPPHPAHPAYPALVYIDAVALNYSTIYQTFHH